MLLLLSHVLGLGQLALRLDLLLTLLLPSVLVSEVPGHTGTATVRICHSRNPFLAVLSSSRSLVVCRLVGFILKNFFKLF